MMSKAIATGFTWLCLAVVVVHGCTTVSPHDNFVNIMNRKVGKKWMDLRPHQFPPDKDLISTRALPNGNEEKKYMAGFGRKRPCIQVYQIDPKTDVIVGADFEGRDEDCVAVP